MKKLLAIAVAAAFTAPMVASADVTVGGKIHQTYNFGSAGKVIADGGGNKFTINANTPLHNGMTGTASIVHSFNASGSAADVANTSGKLGIKGGFGHVTIGAVGTPMDMVDDVVGFMPNDFGFGDGAGSQGINYTGTFGGLTASALVRPNIIAGTENEVGLTYKAGPIAAGLGLASTTLGTDSKTRLALAYNGANYNVGAQIDKSEAGTKSTSIGGKYSFGKAYVSASIGKNNNVKMNAVKVGYALGSKTSVYLVSSDDGVATSRSNAIGIVQTF